MKAPGGEIQRAELFANVDELLAWKKSFDKKQAEMIAWMAKVERNLENIISGCHKLCDGEEILGNRMDMINKRLRQLEERK
jgi:hypothetical protein